ncbi:hypothetical protein ACLB2K_040980 [Fragaria x ananassa]
MPNMGEPPLGAANTSAMLYDAFGMHGPDNNDDNVEDQDVPPPNLTPAAENFYRLIKKGQKELYPSCGRSKLDFILELYQLKAETLGVMFLSQLLLFIVIFTISSGLLNLLKNWLLEAKLPANFYQTKKLVTALALPWEKINVCPNDCMLFWKLDKKLRNCKHCGASRYKSKIVSGRRIRVADKVLRYYMNDGGLSSPR